MIYKVCNRPEARPTRSTHVCYYARYMILDTAYACTEFRGSQYSFVDNALGKPQISHFAFFKIYATAEIDLVFCPGPEHELWSSAGSGPRAFRLPVHDELMTVNVRLCCCPTAGWLCWRRCRLQAGITAEADRHPGQPTEHESAPLRCHGNCSLHLTHE